MPYRDFELPDGRVVRTRVSDEATLQWWHDGKGQGYPDRPPDIDSDTQRGWFSPHQQYQDQVSAKHVGSYVVNLGPQLPTCKLIVTHLSPGEGWYMRLKMESGLLETLGESLVGADRLFPYGQEDAMNSLIDETLEAFFALEAITVTLMGSQAEWLVTGPLDGIELDQAVEEAYADWLIEFADEIAKAETMPEPETPSPPGTGH